MPFLPSLLAPLPLCAGLGPAPGRGAAGLCVPRRGGWGGKPQSLHVAAAAGRAAPRAASWGFGGCYCLRGVMVAARYWRAVASWYIEGSSLPTPIPQSRFQNCCAGNNFDIFASKSPSPAVLALYGRGRWLRWRMRVSQQCLEWGAL